MTTLAPPVPVEPRIEPSPEPLLRIRDNPIAIAQFRRRMRPRQAIPSLAVVAILGLCGVMLELTRPEPIARRLVRDGMFGLLALVVCFGGTARTAMIVAADRKSGLLDFHRATPTTAWTDCLGYLFGSPSREHAAAGVLLPFVLFGTWLAGESPLALFAALGVVLFSGVFYQALGLLAGLTAIPGRAARFAVFFLLVLPIFHSIRSGQLSWIGHLTPLPAIASFGFFGDRLQGASGVAFYGTRLPACVYSLLLQGVLLAFALLDGVRKLRQEGAHAFSRRGALAFFALLAGVALGPVWSSIQGPASLGAAIACYSAAALALACALAASLVPTYLEHVRTERRAARAGRRVRWLEQGAPAWPLVPALLAVFSAGALLLAARGVGLGLDSWSGLLANREAALVLASAASLLALVIGILEHARLRLRRSGRSGTFLVAFLIFALPWLLALIVGSGDGDFKAVTYLCAVSPVFGAVGSVGALATKWGFGGFSGQNLGPVVASVAISAALAVLLALLTRRVRNAAAG